jgi:hypothetical protein
LLFPMYRTSAVLILLCALPGSCAQTPPQPNIVAQWNKAALQGVRDARLGAPMVARALAVVHTCIYDAWAAYDEHAVGTQLAGTLRRPFAERTLANKQKAISMAAYRALVDVLPVDTDSIYRPLLEQLGYDRNDNSTDIETAAGIGNVACAAVLEFRHRDKSNQLGDLAQGQYSDWTGYSAINKPTVVPVRPGIDDPNHWQPLVYVNSSGSIVSQRFIGAHWCYMTPFALSQGDEFRAVIAKSSEPATYGSLAYQQQAEELVQISEGLTDRQKMISEYWSDGPNSEQPPGHWMLFAQWISARDRHSLDDDVKMFFVLSNSMMDAGIAAWDMKRAFDSVRPVTAIPLLFAGKKIRAWGGPGKGTIEMDGARWIPYQPTTFPTPPFPDYVSGHSAYSAAAASILTSWTGSDRFGYSTILSAGSSRIEPGVTPVRSLTLRLPSFSAAAEEAGLSRRYGGLHFSRADVAGRQLGQLVAAKVWSRAQAYFDGSAKPVIPSSIMASRKRD